MSQWKVAHGDCLEILRAIPDNSFHSMVTDPPGGIEFMGKRNKWDSSRGGRDQWVAWLEERLRECYRVLLPGAHALVWGIPRTSYWTATALDNAGFDIRDIIHHIYGQGGPKVKKLGDGWSTALKPAAEHWILARKPVEGTITQNFGKYGTGGLNTDACRVQRGTDDVPGWHKSGADGSAGYQGESTFRIRAMSAEEIQERCGDTGRWPPNLVLSEGADEVLDAETGPKKSGKMKASTRRKNREGYAGPMPEFTGKETYGDSGGVSRYFPCFGYFAKPSRSEKEAGLDDFPTVTLNRVNPGGLERDPRFAPVQVKNNHNTVKGIKLMQWLCTLVTPEGGYILDPFTGSGSTGCAAVPLGFGFFGCELSEEYVQIARARIRYWEIKTKCAR